MGFSYLNEQYIGLLCEGTGDYPIDTPSGAPVGSVFQGESNDSYNNVCVFYRSGISNGTFNGVQDEDVDGITAGVFAGSVIYDGSGSVTFHRNFGQLNASFNGSFSHDNASYDAQHILKMTMPSGKIAITIAGVLKGLGHTGEFVYDYIEQEGLVDIEYFSGSFYGVFSGEGYVRWTPLLLEIDVDRPTVFEGSELNIVLSGEHEFAPISGNGHLYSNGIWTRLSHTGIREGLVSGLGAGYFSGYRSGVCQSSSPNYATADCNNFGPLVNNCNYSGQLNVQIEYPGTGDSYIMYRFNGTGAQSYTALDITAAGSVDWGDDYAPIVDPAPTGDDGDGLETLVCPYVESQQPTCAVGNDGSLIFVLENTNYSECNLIPPYSGWVGRIYDLDTVEEYLWAPGPIPNKLSFFNLDQGLYLMNLSGQSGTSRQILAGLENQGELTVNYDELLAPSSCNASDGVIRYTWNGGTYNYNIEGTSIAGTSPSGFIAAGLKAGDYHGWITSSFGTQCKSEINFGLSPSNPLRGVVTTQGVSCTGDGSDGWAFVEAEGGTPPYTYRWDTDPFDGYGGQYIEGLSGGGYSALVYDANGCSDEVTAYIGVEDKNLSVNVSTDKIAQLVCCQAAKAEDYATITADVFGGTPPYTYSWNGGVSTTGNVLTNIKQGTFSVTVQDANNCIAQSNSLTIKSSNICLKQKWTVVAIVGGAERPDVFYFEQEELVPPEQYETTFPMTFLVPGDYLIKLMMTDAFGRNGTDCVNIKIVPYKSIGNDAPGPSPSPTPGPGPTPSPSPTPSPTPGPVPTPSPNPGPGPTPPPTPPPRKVCCKLLSLTAGSSGKCRTYCTPLTGSSGCSGSDALPAKPSTGSCTAAGQDPCDGLWTAKSGSCCLQRAEKNSAGVNYIVSECVTVSNVCDLTNYCDMLAKEGNYDWGKFTEGGKCDKDSRAKQGCGEVGACCPSPDDYSSGFGRPCLPEMQSHECIADNGDFLGHKSTCTGSGTIDCNGTRYCELYDGVCCNEAATPKCHGVMNKCECTNRDASATWTKLGEMDSCDTLCTDPLACHGHGEDGCQCEGRLALGLDCCCPVNEAPTGPYGSCEPDPCPNH